MIDRANYFVYMISDIGLEIVSKDEFNYTYPNVYFIKGHNFISDMPQVPTYNLDKQSGEAFRFNLDKKIFHRNSFIFNDSKASRTWLLLNDREFIKRLVTVFGYDSDEQFNMLVLKDAFKEAYPEDRRSRVNEVLLGLFADKGPDGKLRIKTGRMQTVVDNANPKDIYSLNPVGLLIDYATALISPFDETGKMLFKGLTKDERYKIAAYAGY